MRGATTSNIRRFVNSKDYGELFTTRELLKFGPRAAVDKTTSRMVRAGEMVRVAWGVFVKARDESDIPSLAEIIKKKVEAFGRKLYVHGTNALKRVEGGVEKTAEEPIFATDGNTTSFYALQCRIRLKHYAARKLHLLDSFYGLMIRGLWEAGKDFLTGPVIEKVSDKLGRTERAAKFTHTHWMPAWMSDPFVHGVWPEARAPSKISWFG